MRSQETRKKTMAALSKPPFPGAVCSPWAEKCSDLGAFCARRQEQVIAHAYPALARVAHAVLLQGEQTFIRSVSFENVVLPGLRHGKYACRPEAAAGEASHHQGLEGRTRKKVRSLRPCWSSPPWIGRRERPRATVGQGGQVNAGATWVCPPVRPTSPMVIGSRASPPPTHRREDTPPHSLGPLDQRWPDRGRGGPVLTESRASTSASPLDFCTGR